MRKGFTLSELLIALAILGVIATFTIPKVLQAQQNGSSKAVTKEAIAAVSAAYQIYRASGAATSATKASHITPYLNYVKWDTSSLIDGPPTVGSSDCSLIPCARLHNGAILQFLDTRSFGGTTSLNCVEFRVDPDGVYSGTTVDGPSKAFQFMLYYDGGITSRGYPRPGANNTGGTYTDSPTLDPTWFSWN